SQISNPRLTEFESVAARKRRTIHRSRKTRKGVQDIASRSIDETDHVSICCGRDPHDCFGGNVLSLFAGQLHGCRELAVEWKSCFFQRPAFTRNSGASSSPEQQYRGD